MPRLTSEDVVGADAIFACLGPALEIFSRFASVEKASGEAVTLDEYLEQPGPRGKLKNQIFLGSEAFMASLQRTIQGDARLREIPAVQRRPRPEPLAQIAEAHEGDEAILRAHASGGYSLKEIGDYFGLHYSRVSPIVKKRRLARDKTGLEEHSGYPNDWTDPGLQDIGVGGEGMMGFAALYPSYENYAGCGLLI